MQSEAGTATLGPLELPWVDYSSLVLVEDDQIFTRSRAIIRLARHLIFPWPLLAGVLALVPSPLLDAVYRLVAQHRHRVIGRMDRCVEPEPDISRRYIA